MTLKEMIKRVVLGADEQPIPELGRNERCWCGSGKKYKSCHMAGDNQKRAAQRSSGKAQQSNPALRGF